MKKSLLFASAAAIALAAPAFAADKETYKSNTKIEKDSKGNYESKSDVSKTDMSGTTTEVEKKVDVDVDNDGTTDTTVKTEASTDPKGLMNKSKTKVEDKVDEQANGSTVTTHKKVVDGKTVENTKEVQK